MTDIHPIDVAPDVAERIRRRAHTLLREHEDHGIVARLERWVGQWIEPPLAAAFATALIVWALRAAALPTL
jgi:hypothetical protein